jgi:hypothetical protein
MATLKLFSVAGVSKRKGAYKVRFANDAMRVKVLIKGGHEDVRLVALDQPQTKMQAVHTIKNMAEFGDVAAQATFAEFIEENTPKTPTRHTRKQATELICPAGEEMSLGDTAPF